MKQQVLTAILAIFLVSAGASIAADGIVIGSGSVDFTAGGSAAVVTVSGPEGFHYRQELDAGSVATMSLFDEDGNKLADGTYKWQLTQVKAKAPAKRSSYAGKSEPLSGVFTIDDGSVANPKALEGSLNKDQVFLDDLIVDGSACIGIDCANGENFGFDTIRLKENNLRIKFDDTSGSASFPNNDWQLTANDSSNGGANKFSIDDITGGKTPLTVEAGAPSHSLYVDDAGNVGLSTSTPVVELHVADGDSPTLRLEQNGSSGFTPQTWDLAGNETNFFVRDVTNGSKLPFRIRPGAPDSSIDIAADGNVGVGTSSPKGDLHVLSGGNAFTPAYGAELLLQDSATVDSSGAGSALLSLISNAAGTSQINMGEPSAEFDGRIVYDHAPDQMDFYINGAIEMRLSAAGLVTFTSGACDPGPCDGTFTDYELESIEEHAAYMWENSHLWGVGPTADDGPINLSKKTAGILHELATAHISIAQLNGTVKLLEERLAEMEGSQD